jgi:DNA-binding SARP family transcriptional activator/ATP/maltotriose-dependent transcriptional regulator MalT
VSASEVPSEAVDRERLLRRITGAHLILIEAGGGYGKSVLAAQLRRRVETASAVAELERDTGDPEQLVGAMRRGLRRAGLSDIASAIDGASVGEVAAALSRSPEPLLLVVEEAQHAAGEAAEALAGLARRVERGRLVLIARRLDPRLAELRSAADAVHLDSTELAFDDEELRALLATALGAEPSNEQVTRVRQVTDGWPAAAALAATGMQRGDDSLPMAGGRLLAGLIDGLLAGSDAQTRERIGRLAHLPLLSERVAKACAGDGSLAALVDAGLPVRSTRPGWLELPDPIREQLADEVALDRDAARAAANAYADSGELATALTLLARQDDSEGVAALIGGRRWQELAQLELAELRAMVTTLPREALASNAGALVQVARVAERDGDLDYRAELLGSALDLVADGSERRETEAELIATRAMLAPGPEVVRAAEAILDTADGSETRARARALTAIGRVAAWSGAPAEMLQAERALAEAAALCRLAGEIEWQARTLVGLGYRVAFARGELEPAVAHMAEALALLPEPGRERATAATFQGDVLAYVGRFEEASAAIGEAMSIGRNLGDSRLRAYAAWTGMTLASLRGDAASTVQRIRTVELHPGEWFEHPTGIEFLAEAALALARTGAADAAAEYAARATERAEAAGHPEIAWLAEGAVAARWGDPQRAEQDLVRYAGSPQQAPRDEWRTLLFRAQAASRRGDPQATSLAAQAYEAAAELGRPDLPELHEPDIAAFVVELARAAGSQAAAPASAVGARATVVTLLGGFKVTVAGRELDPPAGRPSTLIKVLALSDSPVTVDEAVELLWPGSDGPTGRRRMRNLLNRLRSSCGELVGREGEALVLRPGTEVDARLFERDAAAVGAADPAARPGLARGALARYPGELLPQDRYEPWATAPRERLRRRSLELLDLLVEDAAERGEIDEAIRLLDRAMAAEPLDEDRHLRAAELLLFQGRRGSARTLVERAAAIRTELGLGSSPRLERLRSSTVGR